MKKTVCKFLALCMSFLLLMSLVGCGSKYTGFYSFQSLLPGSATEIKSDDVLAEHPNFRFTLELAKDGTFTLILNPGDENDQDSPQQGTWTEKDGLLTLTLKDDDQSVYGKIEGDLLILREFVDDEQPIATFTKQ